MAYLGKDVVGIMSYSRAKDTMTGDGSTTTLTLSRDPGTQNNVEIYMDGVLQTPGVEYTLAGKVVTFTTAPETGLNVVALSGTETEIMEPADNSVVASHLVGGLSLTDAKIAGLSSSKLSGALPALDGSALTNMSGGINVKSASDPATDTNHANGVGTTWVNTTSGEMFVCTDATTDANVWFNVGAGTGNVVPYTYGGTIAGYQTGGHPNSNVINKYSFASATTNASNIGSLTVARHAPGGNSSKLFGYSCGGNTSVAGNVIDKFSFTTDGDATDHGDLSVSRSYPSEPGQTSSTHGFTSGGYSTAPVSTIDSFAFDSNGDASGHGDLSTSRTSSYGQSSSTHGYAVHDSIMDKFSFASNTTASDVGEASLSQRRTGAGQSSETHGYATGAEPANDVIDKFAFATEGTMTDVGNLTVTHSNCCAQSSTTYGYTSGGDGNNVIERHSFASDGNAADVGDMSNTIGYVAGQQY